MRPKTAKLAQEWLKRRGVEVVLNCQVTSATANGIQTKDGRSIPSRTVVWVAGVKPVPLAEALQVEKARDGRIVVDDKLGVPSLPGLYVVGDCAYAVQKGTSAAYPPTAQVAMRMGRACAWNVANAILGRPARPFDYKYKGDLVFLGRNYAVGEIGGLVVSGVPGFVMYQAYFLQRLMGFKNKLSTFIDWSYDYFYRRNTAKLD